MTKANETIKALKVLLGMEKADKVEFKAITLKDGTALNADKLEVGGMVVDSEQKPVAAGTYELEDGSMIVVDAEGKITEVKEAKVEETAAAEVAPEVETEVETETAPSVEERIANLEKAIEEIMNIIKQMSSKFEKKIETIEKETIETPAVFTKVEKKYEEMNAFEQFMASRKK